MKEAFVYRWTETTTNKWYIGYHKGTPDDGYICSSKIVKPLIISNPTNWTREIIAYGSKQEMLNLEKQMLIELNARDDVMSYNKHNGNGHTKTGRKKGVTNKLTPAKILKAFDEVFGMSWYKFILLEFFNAVQSNNQEEKEHYADIISKVYGIKKEILV